ncbi:MAG TPA: beta-ketoacyl synthase N-terminal-like domain-containing protein, partial [Solirubrobacteraceae bacterium]
MREVVVTGIGAVTPLGVGARTLHARWAAGQVAIQDGEAPCADFDPLEFFSRKEARRADRFTQLALAAAREAIDESGWGEDGPYAPERIGCILGTGIGGIDTLETNFGTLRDQGPERVAPLAVPLMMSNAGSAAIAMRHDLRGPVFGVVSACAAGANAIAAATRAIQCSDADAVVTGGSEAALTPLARAAFS